MPAMAEVSECRPEETPPPAHGEEAQEIQLPAHGEEAQEIQLPAHGEEAQEIQLLLDKVKELEDSIREKEKMKADILNKIKEIRLKDADSKVCQTELISSQQITDRIIILFVEGLEKAHRYFDLKQYIRERRYFEELDNGQSDIFDIILEKIEKDNPFGGDEDEIYFAAKAVRQEVNVEGLRKRRAVYENRFNGRDLRHLYTLPNLTTEEKEELLAHMFPCFPNYELEATDSYAHFTPILDLVYQIREKDYVIDEKPEVELEKIEKSDPRFYNHYFVYEEEPMELMEYLDDTVAVMNVPIDTAVYDIDESLMDCGEVIGIREESGKNSQTGKKCKIVFVTFEDSAAAKRALLKESPLVDGRQVEITTPQSASAWLMPKEVRTISSVESALEKYKELMEKYQKKSSSVEDA